MRALDFRARHNAEETIDVGPCPDRTYSSTWRTATGGSRAKISYSQVISLRPLVANLRRATRGYSFGRPAFDGSDWSAICYANHSRVQNGTFSGGVFSCIGSGQLR